MMQAPQWAPISALTISGARELQLRIWKKVSLGTPRSYSFKGENRKPS